jgi:predicted metal-binding membrane protein
MMSSPATLQAPRPLTGRIQVGLVALLLILAAASWVVTGDRMSGMDDGPGTELGGVGWFMVGWLTMMAAMMLPSLSPAALAYARMQPGGSTALFVAGYLVTWGAIGVVGYVLVESVRSLELGFFAWENGGRYVAAGVIVGAAAYQLTASKDACLRTCRSPTASLREHWRPGGAGALWMGVVHGGFCVGCCWALMAVLLALGVMSVGWMALVATLVAIEKLLPWRSIATGGTATLLATLGLAVALVPEEVPGLTVPGADASMGMGAMERGR